MPYASNEKKREANAAYRRQNREKVLACNRAWAKRNREHVRSRARAWYANHRDAMCVAARARSHGLTVAEMEALGVSCHICGADGSGVKRAPALYVDHCHETGRVRGVLCHGCNSGIGYLKDDPALLAKAAEYLTNAGD